MFRSRRVDFSGECTFVLGRSSDDGLSYAKTMRIAAFKIFTASAITIAFFTVFLTWYPFVFSLAWPGLTLARFGLPYSSIFAAAVALSGLVWLAVRIRCQSWLRIVNGSAVFSAAYCGVAFLFAARLPIPSPAIAPYEVLPLQNAAYLKAYEEGYRYGTLGIIRTYCFAPESETSGFYDGLYQGQVVWWRFLGRAMPKHVKQGLEVSAGRDGVVMDLTSPETKPSQH
jgi:hypothetical protein